MSTRKHLLFCGLLIASTVIFWKTITALVAYSLANESSSHVLLIPIVSIGLLYMDRARIFAKSHSSVAVGLALVAIGSSFYLLALRLWSASEGNLFLSASTLALWMIWIGLFVSVYGTRASWTAIFPLMFLVLMIPIPDPLLAKTIYALQQGSTEIAFLLFKLFGIPVFRQGFLLTVPGVTIEVAKECSGIRSSVALFITCLLAAHLFLKKPWNMIVFVLLAFPLAILKNGIRITTLTMLSIYVDPRFLTGSLHHDGGFVFFLLALIILAPVLIYMQKAERTSNRSDLMNDGLAIAPGSKS